MNSVFLIGRLVRDPDVKYTSGTQMAMARFTLACDNGKDRDGNKREADFVPCIAWDKKAEAIEKYVKKGQLFSVRGKFQTGSYVDDNGDKKYTYNVLVQEMQFIDYGEQKQEPRQEQRREHTEKQVDMTDLEALDEDVPF